MVSQKYSYVLSTGRYTVPPFYEATHAAYISDEPAVQPILVFGDL